MILSGIKAWSYYKRNHNGTLSVAVLLWYLIYAMGAVGTVITSVCIGVCVYLFVFYKGQTVPYVLLPDDVSEKSIQTYITVAFSFKVSETKDPLRWKLIETKLRIVFAKHIALELF